MTKYVVVGNGIAGITTAQMVIPADENAEVHVLGREKYPYYQRPRLWEFIAGEVEQENLYFRPLDWYAQKGIDIHLDTQVQALDSKEHRVILADGSKVDYDRLLLATGARAFVPPIAGADKDGVFVLRNLDDALAIKERSGHCMSVAVIGGGLLGLETARALQAAGLDVTVIEFAPYLLPRQLDEEGGRTLQAILEEMGLHFLTGAETEAILGDDQVTGVRIKGGQVLDCQMALFSTGIRSRIELPRDAGLEVNRGVVVDEHLATSAEDVYAAGDVAEFRGITYGIIPAAIDQARIAAANMVEPGSATYPGTLRSTTLKIVGVQLTCLGEAIASGEECDIIRQTDLQNGVYQRLAIQNGKVVGAILLGDTKMVRTLKKLIQSQRDVSGHEDVLLETDFDLNDLVT